MVEVNFTLLMVGLVATWACGALTAYSMYLIIENQETIEKELQ